MNAPPDESAFTGGSDPAGREGQSPPQDSRRYEPPSRTEVLVLEEGQRLVTDFITIVAMRGKDSVEVECNCTEATPDRPGCETSIDKTPGGIKVTCTPVGGATLAARRYACLPEG
jgi:hypothetical protein